MVDRKVGLAWKYNGHFVPLDSERRPGSKLKTRLFGKFERAAATLADPRPVVQ